MKKTIYILLIALSTSFILTSCTEEEIKPSTELRSGGGASDPKK